MLSLSELARIKDIQMSGSMVTCHVSSNVFGLIAFGELPSDRRPRFVYGFLFIKLISNSNIITTRR